MAALDTHGPDSDVQLGHALLRLLHALAASKGGGGVVDALAGADGERLLEQLVQTHAAIASLTSINAHLVVACLWAACSAGGPDTLDRMAASRPCLEVLLGHVVFASLQPGQLFTRTGLATTTRALRVVFTLQAGGLPHSGDVQQLCSSAGLSGRVLALMEHQPETHMQDPSLPSNALKGHSLGELYVELLSAAVSYSGYSSSIFAAQGGSLALDAGLVRTASNWLLADATLPALHTALRVMTRALYDNLWLGHVEAPDTRPVEAAVRNILLLLALPLCSAGSRRGPDVVEAVTFALRLFRRLYRLEFGALFERMMEANHPDAAAAHGAQSGPARFYRRGAHQPFYEAVAAVMVDALITLGPSLEVGPALSSEQATEMAAFIKQQVPRLTAWSVVLSEAIQGSQQAAAGAPLVVEYRPAEGNARRCATCGVRAAQLLTCKRCGVAKYCGRDCQVAHWAALHKAQCPALQQAHVVS